jgi:hypothetical protein
LGWEESADFLAIFSVLRRSLWLWVDILAADSQLSPVFGQFTLLAFVNCFLVVALSRSTPQLTVDVLYGALFAITALGGDLLAHNGQLADSFRASADVFGPAKEGDFTVLVHRWR